MRLCLPNRIGVQQNRTWYTPLPDALGSVRQWAHATGAVVGTASYTPFGVPTQHQGLTPAPWGLSGEWYDTATGLQYLRARWYQPQTGRFTQVDPFPGVLSLPGTQHPYSYGLNNPTRYTDPSGESVSGLVIAAIVGGFAVGGAISSIEFYLHSSSVCNINISDALLAFGVGFVGGALLGIGVLGTTGISAILASIGAGILISADVYLINLILKEECFDRTDFLLTVSIAAIEGALAGLGSPTISILASAVAGGIEPLAQDVAHDRPINGQVILTGVVIGGASGIIAEGVTNMKGILPEKGIRIKNLSPQLLDFTPLAMQKSILEDIIMKRRVSAALRAMRTIFRDIIYTLLFENWFEFSLLQ